MKDREIQELLLTHYLFVAEMIKSENSIHTIDIILESMYVDWGVCKCAKMGFGVNVTNKEWVKRFDRAKSFESGPLWGKKPIYSFTKDKVFARLMIRINNLQLLLS